ncbi:class I SAM-dependent methyltransferase [Anaeromyxobacter diazotrophicus]|uniref:Methyltransferase n=1 Tax=Anaeromyxobacter diazotrophicus TaxID=2590199 RepID=A0A7I9VPS7_9BACT|nr:class I SAM-dependent methyltransferase [Anaeromyxobacter diazotrophicus]GEJ58361.1 methyltransferase [Anaeromyxobacter diazotrophicus]
MRGLEQIPWLYDAGMALADRRWLARWRDWLAGGARGRVLELGCGTGRNLPRYPPGAALVAVDPHPQNLARARRRAPGVPLVQARAEALPFRDGAFESVVAALVLCSVDDPPRALAEVRRVLAPGGALRAVEHVRARGWQARLQDAVQPAWTHVSGGCRPNRDTEAAVEAAGFRLEQEGRRTRGLFRRFSAVKRGP